MSEISGLPNWQRIAVLWLPAAICFLVGGLTLPSPSGVNEEQAARKNLSHLKGVVLQERPRPKKKLDVNLGDKIGILGVDLPKAPLAPGADLELKTYFEVLDEIPKDWQIFMHIDREGQPFRIHGDHYPSKGRFHTSAWTKGQFVVDLYKRPLPGDARPGTYSIHMGFYVGKTRMPFRGGDKSLHAGDNRIKIGTIEIK